MTLRSFEVVIYSSCEGFEVTWCLRYFKRFSNFVIISSHVILCIAKSILCVKSTYKSHFFNALKTGNFLKHENFKESRLNFPAKTFDFSNSFLCQCSLKSFQVAKNSYFSFLLRDKLIFQVKVTVFENHWKSLILQHCEVNDLIRGH